MKISLSVALASLMVACGEGSPDELPKPVNLTSLLEESKLCITDTDGTRDCTYSVDPDDAPFFVENVGSTTPSVHGSLSTKTYTVDITNTTVPCAIVRANSNHPILKNSSSEDRTSYVSLLHERVSSDLSTCKK